MMKKSILSLCISLSLPLWSAILNVPPGTDTLQPAVVAAAPGDTLLLDRNGTYIITSMEGPVVIDKPLTIQTDPVPPGAQAIVTIDLLDPLPLPVLFIINSEFVTLQDFTIDDQLTAATLIETIPIDPIPFLADITLDALLLKYSNLGMQIINSGTLISNNTFETLIPLILPIQYHEAIRLEGLFAEVRIENNLFTSVASGDSGTVFCHAMDSFGAPFIGTLSIINNQMIGITPLHQFLRMDSFANSSPGSSTLHLDGNAFAAINGSFYFFSSITLPADIFAEFTVTNNIDSSNPPNGYKGLVAFDGTPPGGKEVATNPAMFTFANNTLLIDEITAAGWIPYDLTLYPGGLFGINAEIYDPLIPPIGDLRGSQYLERFATQGDLVNYLTWQNLSSATEFFRIYKNSPTNLIATLPAKPGINHFAEHRQKQGVPVTYFIGAVTGGSESSLISVTVP